MRKRWTPNTDVSESLLLFREKRKWQIALRRYVLQSNKSSRYAPYFGLDSANFRQWIQIYFDNDLNWANFSSSWQFDHHLPITYFDFSKDQDMRLCWNFVNIKVQKMIPSENKQAHGDILTAKNRFQVLFQETGNSVCQLLVQKIQELETRDRPTQQEEIAFLSTHQELINQLSQFSPSEFDQVNAGTQMAEIQAQKELVKKFGNP